ncbi:hypothetical protein QNO07_09360 [Streptomyces sp. 549]|uniref:hypothetical protein n=1 Tax=Streptomyces sp. 549 TaxID=3049076 RepID=UPI0024C34105|nr:hypothetical protein [Streptomyces sp. 549]MDK1473626.1 hypothetical protein [Streptomyces sp. 549]
MPDTNLPDPAPRYLVEHSRASRKLFTLPGDAREWAEKQTHFHYPRWSTRWVSGGEHGWEQLRLGDGTTAATVYTLLLDETLEDSRFASYWDEG